jgi:hypothetical protein
MRQTVTMCLRPVYLRLWIEDPLLILPTHRELGNLSVFYVDDR